jgi:hypothetical protein
MRSGKVAQLCRACKVPTSESNDHLHVCKPKKVAEIKKLVEQEDMDGLRQCSQSYLINAFHKVKFSGDNTCGVHGACPSDMLHALLLGLFKYIRDVFFEFIGGKPKEMMNALSAEYSRMFRRQSDRSMPSASFSKGIKVGKLMGKEFRGVLLCMLVMAHSGTGRSILSSSRSQHFTTDEQVQAWCHLLELLLVWEAYLNLDEMTVHHVRKLRKKHRHIMYLIRKVAPRVKGMGLKLMKFHAILHLAEDILLFGVPLEFDTSANESHHKPSKYAAILTQRSHATFTYQTALRLVEFTLIDLALLELNGGGRVHEYYCDIVEEWQAVKQNEGAHCRGPRGDEVEDMELDDEDDGMDQSTTAVQPDEAGHPEEDEVIPVETGGTQIFVSRDEDDGEPIFRLGGKSKFRAKTLWSLDVLHFLVDLQELLSKKLGRECQLDIFTKHVRADQVWRAHPNYRGKGHWRDWAWVDFGGNGEFCCQCWCFVVIPPIPNEVGRLEFGKTWLEEGTFAVVETTKVGAPLEGERASELLMPINKDVVLDETGSVIRKDLSLANTDAFVAPACVVPDIGGPKNRYYVVEARSRWHEVFAEWLTAKKKDVEVRLSNDNKVMDTDDEDEE